MPQSSVIVRFDELAQESGGRLSPAGLCIIANDFGVSVEAMVSRLEGERLIAVGKYQELKERGFKPSEVRKKLGLERVRERIDIVPIRLKRLSIEAYRQALLDETQMSYYLGYNNDILQTREAIDVILGDSAGAFELF